MLASIFSKVTESLGKTFAYAGLLPAAVLIVMISLHATSTHILSEVGQALLRSEDSWKSAVWLGGLWLAGAFLFYAVRAPVFSLFQIIPDGVLGRWLLFRRVKRREQLSRELQEIVWRKTALAWLEKLGLDRSKIGTFPYWIVRPSPQQSLSDSRIGREALLAVDRTAGDALNLTPGPCAAIGSGIFRLFLLARSRHPPDVEHAIEAEIAGWRATIDSERASAVIALVEQDIDRQFARAFQACERFGGGAFIFPTEVGNRISALDDYALQRYGIDTATIWNRLWWILPKEARAEVSDARLALEALLNLTIALWLAALAILTRQVSACGPLPTFGESPCHSTRTIILVAIALITCLAGVSGRQFCDGNSRDQDHDLDRHVPPADAQTIGFFTQDARRRT